MMQQSLFEQANPARYGEGRHQPLILPRLLAAAARGMVLDERQKLAHATMIRWADMELDGRLAKMKETALQGDFLATVFGDALGYARFSAGLDHWEIQEHYSLPRGRDADAAIGFFDKTNGRGPVAVIELKNPTVNVDRQKFSGRTPVRQCWDDLYDLPDCPWGIVCNYVSFRLYHRNHTPQKYELFTLQELRDENRFKEFLWLFGREGLLDPLLSRLPHALLLLAQTVEAKLEVGKQLYRDYHGNRMELVACLCRPPYSKTLDGAIAIAQTLLDRIIFIAFCQDRQLLPHACIEKTWRDIPAFTLVTNPRWKNFISLFRSIDKGNERFDIPPFNGGLFAHNPEVDDLELDDRWTTFFKAVGTYDFANEVDVDVLGHIFEQSITDLEAMRANPQAIQRPEPAVSGKRKREGVYYTPPQITAHIVEETLGPCLAARLAQAAEPFGIAPDVEPTPDSQAKWIDCRRAMLDALRSFRVCDMACGSGAFLIKAFDFLEAAYADLIGPLAHVTGEKEVELLDQARTAILQENLFGVDLSAEAVEIARLALWIRSARKGKPLTDLSGNILCGNSIVDDPEADKRAFDWKGRFAKVFAGGGFDCIISNPPYVKLQNFRKGNPEIAAFLVKRYRSARTGNFDMYLPFIERGLELLKPDGRLGFIAPSVWLFNEYGRGLRDLVRESKALTKFIDFKSHQVFPDATTYTALQFFTKRPAESIEVIDAPDGRPEDKTPFQVSYDGLGEGAWALLPKNGRRIVAKMKETCITLGEASDQIFQGIITSDDELYHLTRIGPGKLYSYSLNDTVEIEADLLRPLVSGEDAVPFALPQTDKFLLFPYLLTNKECRLLTPKEMRKYKRGWDYLQKQEKRLRAREHGRFNDDEWYRFGRPQNIDKQELPKLGVPQTVAHLCAFCDPKGERYFNNVRVNGIIERADRAFSLWFLLAILNSRAADFFFRQTSKPKDRGYFEANKQFIAPLPVPNLKPAQQRPVAELARKLADLHGRRLDALAVVRRRIVVDLAPKALVDASPLPPPLPRKLEAIDELSPTDALSEMQRFAKRKLKPAEREQWDQWLAGKASDLAGIAAKIRDLTAELNALVYSLYGLDEQDIRVIEGS